jgi:L-serine dehydratase
MISAFDIFKIGIGPSSSHTVGPMLAAKRFVEGLGAVADGARLSVELFGSLAWTGRGHATDTAIFLGLLGETPARVDLGEITAKVDRLRADRMLVLGVHTRIAFDPDSDLVFNLETLLPGHSNGMRFRLLTDKGTIGHEQIFYSIGGGAIHADGEQPDLTAPIVVHPFESMAGLLRICAETTASIADIQMRNELGLRSRADVDRGLDLTRDTMFASIDRGLTGEGELPGRLRVKRRARRLHEALQSSRLSNRHHPHEIMDWVSTFAMAVNEENACGGRVVTAPTNGAAGTLPAVLRYFHDFCSEYTDERSHVFLLTAAAIGGLIKRNASISGAEVGCQGEVGSAASMAAAGLAAALGANPAQVENAAEIAMEHHLGMTCDPIGGLVQIPCIERNAIGAIKAIAAASLAMRGDGTHHVTLDQVIATMRQTGADMKSQYKETSRGGLAVNVPEC